MELVSFLLRIASSVYIYMGTNDCELDITVAGLFALAFKCLLNLHSAPRRHSTVIGFAWPKAIAHEGDDCFFRESLIGSFNELDYVSDLCVQSDDCNASPRVSAFSL